MDTVVLARVKNGFEHILRYLDVNKTWKSCLVIFILSFGIRTSLIVWRMQYLKAEIPEAVRIAQSVAQTGVFGNPYMVPTGPTAHSAPFFPFLLGMVYRFFGQGQQGELAKELLSTAACSLQYSILPFAAGCLGWPARIGVLGGLMGALFPFRFWLETKGSLEQVYVALALLWVVIETGAAWKTRQYTLSSAIRRGVAWGVAFHVSASLLPVCLALLAIEVFVIEKGHVRSQIRYLAILVVVMILLVLPWTGRNYFQFGKLFFMRDNLGLELSVSNNEFAKPLLDDNITAPKYHHPGSSVAEAIKLQGMGEIAYNRERLGEALGWIEAHPAAFGKLTLLRVRYFWFPRMQRAWQTLFYGLLTLFGFCGAYRAVCRRELAALLILSAWLTFPLIYYLIESADRYRYPIDWMLLLCACYCLDGIMIAANRSEQKPSLASPTPS
jgi:hypothetical protein